MEDLFNPEEKMICPYNSSHHIRRCRMAVHLVKCKKNYPNQEMKTCVFNACHIIPAPELQYHHQTCYDRRKIESQIVESSSRSNKYPVKIIEVENEESWEHEAYCPTYDPKKNVQDKDVLRHMDVESQGKRKNFRMEERQRLNELNSNFRKLETTVKTPVPEPNTSSVTLPKHKKVTTVREKVNLQERLRLGANKLYIPEIE